MIRKDGTMAYSLTGLDRRSGRPTLSQDWAGGQEGLLSHRIRQEVRKAHSLTGLGRRTGRPTLSQGWTRGQEGPLSHRIGQEGRKAHSLLHCAVPSLQILHDATLQNGDT